MGEHCGGPFDDGHDRDDEPQARPRQRLFHEYSIDRPNRHHRDRLAVADASGGRRNTYINVRRMTAWSDNISNYLELSLIHSAASVGEDPLATFAHEINAKQESDRRLSGRSCPPLDERQCPVRPTLPKTIVFER